MNFYNEFDPAAAAWLRELISRGLIPAGVVDERSITDIQPHELSAYTQCHFFCGIAGWPLALELAGWDPTRPVWTGSCPCQPYSAAGKGLGDADPRNLWPAFFRLIRECRPDVVFGEQVESAVGHGWLDGVSADVEGESYAVGAAVLGAHSVLAPHIRQRLYWVADSISPRLQGHAGDGADGDQPGRLDAHEAGSVAAGGAVGGLADAASDRSQGAGESAGEDEGWQTEDNGRQRPAKHGHARRLANSERDGRRADQPERGPEGRTVDRRACGGAESGRLGDSTGRGLGIVGDAARPGSGGHADGAGGASCGMGDTDSGRRSECGERDSGPVGSQLEAPCGADLGRSDPWSDSYWLLCRDGKHRRVPAEPALFPLADGLPYKLARRGSIRPALLKGAGNAIVPQVAAEFISAFLESTKRHHENV